MEYTDTDNWTKGKIKITLMSIFYILSLYYHFSVAKEMKIKMSQITNLIRFDQTPGNHDRDLNCKGIAYK